MEIILCATAPSLRRQIKKQGYDVPLELGHLQKQSDAITLLVIAGLLTDSECRRARHRLMKKLTRAICRTLKGGAK